MNVLYLKINQQFNVYLDFSLKHYGGPCFNSTNLRGNKRNIQRTLLYVSNVALKISIFHIEYLIYKPHTVYRC